MVNVKFPAPRGVRDRTTIDQFLTTFSFYNCVSVRKNKLHCHVEPEDLYICTKVVERRHPALYYCWILEYTLNIPNRNIIDFIAFGASDTFN